MVSSCKVSRLEAAVARLGIPLGSFNIETWEEVKPQETACQPNEDPI
jgi:hypothetical protein